jgi:hypothetical protein
MRRDITLTMTLICLAAVLSTTFPRIGLAQNLVGTTWKLNLAKSTFNPGPPPRSATLSYQAEGQGVRATNEGVNAQGNPTKGVLLIITDGKSYPITGSAAFDAGSYKQVDGLTVEGTRTKDGKLMETFTRVLSAHGKTLTLTGTGVNASGQQYNYVSVYDKQ